MILATDEEFPGLETRRGWDPHTVTGDPLPVNVAAATNTQGDTLGFTRLEGPSTSGA